MAPSRRKATVTLRKVLLRVLLWSLGLSALFGAAGVLLAEMESAWRIAATTMWTALCAGVMLICSVLADRPNGRRAGLLGMAAVVIEYVAILALIWRVARPFFAGRFDFEEFIVLEAWFLLLCTIPAMIFLWMSQTAVGRVAGWTGVALAAGAFCLLTVAAWTEAQRGALLPQMWDYYKIASALAGIGPLAVLALVGAGTGDRQHWRWAGVACAAGAFAIVTWAILGDIHGEGHVVVMLIAAACVVAHANVLLHVPIPASQRWLVLGTIAAGALTGGVVIADAAARLWDIYDSSAVEHELALRLAGAAAVLAGCGTLAMLVVARLTRKPEMPEIADIHLEEATIICPLCRHKQKVPLDGWRGAARCGGCGLRMNLGFHAPRCAGCEYSLLMFTGDRCPECGMAIGEQAAPAAEPQPVA